VDFPLLIALLILLVVEMQLLKEEWEELLLKLLLKVEQILVEWIKVNLPLLPLLDPLPLLDLPLPQLPLDLLLPLLDLLPLPLLDLLPLLLLQPLPPLQHLLRNNLLLHKQQNFVR
jgi:fermentation-respiration switch protein FrsA (DUF1100 family)